MSGDMSELRYETIGKRNPKDLLWWIGPYLIYLVAFAVIDFSLVRVLGFIGFWLGFMVLYLAVSELIFRKSNHVVLRDDRLDLWWAEWPTGRGSWGWRHLPYACIESVGVLDDSISVTYHPQLSDDWFSSLRETFAFRPTDPAIASEIRQRVEALKSQAKLQQPVVTTSH
jgi:hypothetical protein